MIVERELPSLDALIAELHSGAERWIALAPAQKALLFREVRETVYAEARAWAEAGAAAKGIADTSLAGEEWISGPWAVLYALNRYIATLESIARTGAPELPSGSARVRSDGQVVVDVFPRSIYDKLLLNGIRAEVRMQPSVTLDSLPQTMGVWYRAAAHRPRVALVLGAGNISSIAPLDVFYKLIADGAVCVLKMNPVNEYLGPIFQRALAPLVREGYLRFVYGGADAGKALCNHPGIDEIHITGSDKTHDRIVFGDGPDAAERKRANDPLFHKPITSELGNVSPTIVVPGDWTDADFQFQAEQIVTQKLHNGGFNCIASQIVVLPQRWQGTSKLLDHIRTVLRQARNRPAYYPGAHARVEALTTAAGAVHPFGAFDAAHTPRAMVVVESTEASDVFSSEAFASVLGVTMLPGDGVEYLDNAVAFANGILWGTLGANIVVHPKTMSAMRAKFEGAVDALRYGCVAVNTWTGVGYFIAESTWGAFPGHTLDNVQSGIGVVHNTYLFSMAEKTVVYGPFAPFPRSLFGYGATLLPKPPWFVTHRKADRVGASLVEYEYRPSPATALNVAVLAMQG